MEANDIPHGVIGSENPKNKLTEVVWVFLKLGLISYGGPAAHVSLMQDEIVRRRKWVDDQRFLDLLGATNLIPGPNSTEMAIHLGFTRAGWPGLIAGGISFMLPAMLIVLGLSWVYQQYGSTPQADLILYGVKPVIIAIILQALVFLGRKAVKDPLTAIVGLVTTGLFLAGFNELILLFGGGFLVMLIRNRHRLTPKLGAAALLPFLSTFGVVVSASSPFSLLTLFLSFLKIGAVLYGGGYVLLAFMRADFVERLGWLTDQQLLDAIAIGQVTPGPLFTSATFVGYQLGGLQGGLIATLGIFLPSFIIVAISNPFIPKMRASPWFGALLDGVNVTALGLMAGVMGQITAGSLVDPLTAVMAVVAMALVFRYKINSTWLVLGGGLVGLAKGLLF